MATMEERQRIRERLHERKSALPAKGENTGIPSITRHKVHEDERYRNVDVVERLMQRDQRFKTKLQEQQEVKKQDEAKLLETYPFQPKLTKESEKLAQRRKESDESGSLDTVERLNQLDRSIKAKIEFLRQQKEELEAQAQRQASQTIICGDKYDKMIFMPFLSVPQREFYERLTQEEEMLVKQLSQIGNGVVQQGVALYEDVHNELYKQDRATKRLQLKASEVYVENELDDVVEQLNYSKSKIAESAIQRNSEQGVALSCPRGE